MEEESLRRKMSSEREERECVRGRGSRAEEEKKGGSRNDQNAPPVLFRLFLVQAESFLLPLI